MWRPLISSARTLGALGAFFYALSAWAQAATFSVDPISVTLGKGNSSASVAITNQSTNKLRLQVTGYTWQQTASGEMQLKPTDDLVFFPQLLTLDPGETRRIRVGVSTEQAASEKSYRIFMEELPSLQAVTAPKGASVTIRMKVGIPVFVSASGAPVVSGTVRAAALRDGMLSFDVVNTGNTHFAIQQVHVVGKGASGADVLSQDISGWYLLPGGTRKFSIPVGRDRCTAIRSLNVQVHADSVNFGDAFPDLSKSCGSASH